MWIHELQHIPQKVTHWSTFPSRAIARANLGKRRWMFSLMTYFKVLINMSKTHGKQNAGLGA